MARIQVGDHRLGIRTVQLEIGGERTFEGYHVIAAIRRVLRYFKADAGLYRVLAHGKLRKTICVKCKDWQRYRLRPPELGGGVSPLQFLELVKRTRVVDSVDFGFLGFGLDLHF